ncbi:MAG: zinc ribbon domain-containing protein [Deltaproteobacteria bacterium]|nr:zinc ribbon domain-containing protein [Deltaproteobacteria bacterium]
MPIYEYECKDCSHCFEVLLLFSSDPPPQCPECQCNMRKQEEYTGAGGMLDPLVGPSF